MFGHQCFKCGTFWASMANPDCEFEIITKLCPNCIAAQLPIVKPNGMVVHPVVAARAKPNM